jgi:hypothetical protein
MTTTNGTPTRQPIPTTSPSSPRAPRRIVLLTGDDHSAVEQVLREYSGAEVSGNRIHADLQRFATEHRGRQVAVEWLGPLGWARFLWCRK